MTAPRYTRLEQIEWWDASLIRNARALVAGAGALGNELVKNLLLLGWGTIVIVDFDRVEESNLSRSALFDTNSIGQPKVDAVVRAAARLNPDCTVIGLDADLRLAVGAGLAARMDVIFGCLDNVAARVAVAQLAGRSEGLVVDGGLTTWEGTVRLYRPPPGPCYVCGLTTADLKELALRRSCLAYAARSQAAGGVATTPTTASATGALMAQQALKWIHRDRHELSVPVGFEIRIDLAHDRFWKIELPQNADCVLHPERARLAAAPVLSWEESWRSGLESARAGFGCADLTVRLPIPVLAGWTCPECQSRADGFRAHLGDAPVFCSACERPVVPDLAHVLTGDEPWAGLSAREMGFPPWTWIDVETAGSSWVLELEGVSPELEVVAERSRP